jgi:group I intron endonuclease
VNKICGIYELINQTNGKRYIGQSVNIEMRFRKHKSELKNNKHLNEHLQRSYNLGHKFDYNIILECERCDLNFYEIGCIKGFEACNGDKGYNIGLGGDVPMLGIKHSETTKQKISISSFGKHNPSEETRRKLSEGQRGEKSAWYGRKHTEEEKRKISEGNLGKIISEEAKRKSSESHRGKHPSEETIVKMKESQILRRQKEQEQKEKENNLFIS